MRASAADRKGLPAVWLKLLGIAGLILAMLVSARPLPARASAAASYTIWNGSPYIANTSAPDAGAIEVGLKFRTDIAGTVTGIRFYKGQANTGLHVGNLWSSTGSLLATANFTAETAVGWQQVTFATPVAVSPGVTYIASYYAPAGHYAVTYGLTPGDLTTSVDNPPLHALRSGTDGLNGVYAYAAASSFPAQGSSKASNYWVDVVVAATVTTPPVASSFSPGNGAVGVAQNTQVTAQFNEEVQPNSLSFSLATGGAAVPARVTWELHQADRSVTLDPQADLAPATTYIATLSGGLDRAGNAMAPVAWSFTTTGVANAAPSAIGQWQPVEKWPMVTVHGGVLHTGSFLGWEAQSPVTTSQVYDPAKGSFTAASMGVDQFCAGLAQMSDGRLLVAGGDHGDMENGGTYGAAIQAVNIFDPATGAWTRAADLKVPRWYPGMLRLADGRILAMSGTSQNLVWVDTPEVYDPVANTWTLLSKVNTSDVHEELYPTTYLLPSGKVLVIAKSTGHTWVLDVNAQTWTQGPTAPLQNATSVMYRPGQILLSGGSSNGFGTSTVASAAIIDMTATTPVWQTVAPMRLARGYHQLINLPDGRVLATGGASVFNTSTNSGRLPAEIWDPAPGTWTTKAAMQDPRMNHSVGVLMPDATVLSAGGGHELQTGAVDYFTAESYSPPYLYGGGRPTITGATATAAYGSTISVQTPDAAGISSVALIGLSAQTHHDDGGASYQALPFTATQGQLSVTAPASGSLAPPGFYMMFLVSKSGVPSVATMLQLAPPDLPPAVVATTPVDGAVNVAANTLPSATFSKPVQPSSVQFTLKDGVGTPVTTATSFNSGTTQATFTPGAPLRFSTTYSATLNGASDLGGRPMAAPVSWSFRTMTAPTCPCAIWSSSASPVTPSGGDFSSVELGVKFQADADGYVTGVRFYKGPNNAGNHVGSLWTASGTLLSRATFSGETVSGWQTVSFPSPIAVTGGTTYVASYFAPAGGYAFDPDYFTNSSYDSPPLHAMKANLVGGDGVFAYAPASTFPGTPSGRNTNYWVDVSFVFSLPPDTTPPVVTQTNPASGSTNASLSAVPSATFSKAVQPASVTFTLTDAAAAAVSGTTTYNAATHVASFTPASPLAPSSQYAATVSGATDQSGNVMKAPVNWTFSTISCPCTVWPASALPGTAAANDGSPVELGLKFRTDSTGYITGVRFYKGAGNGGTHVGNLWTTAGSRLASATFSGESPSGWQQASFGTPVAVAAGTTYVVSYLAPFGHYGYDRGYFARAGVDNGPMHALQAGVDGGNGVFNYSATSGFPGTASAGNSNYWVDAVFEYPAASGPPTVTSQSPTPGATGIPGSTQVSATFSKAVQPVSITFTLGGGGSAVPGAITYDGLSHTATFTPASPLGLGTTYTAVVSGATDLGGVAMAAPTTWSFTTTAAPVCPCMLWPPAAAPGTPSFSDGNAVELGVKFTSDISGQVTAVRFYKGAGNTGTHVGNLWTASGQLLATTTFTNETASGWQQMNLATPVAITAGTVYVVSYFAPAGHYAADGAYFASPYTSGPVHALAGANGVYRYSSATAFPNASNNSTNYWVDVVIAS